jgi:hypothetical protein
MRIFEMPSYALRMARANELTEELHGRMGEYCDSALGINRDTKTVPGHTIFRVAVKEEVPAIWNTQLGDIIHNFRSALDIASCELVRRGGGIVSRETGFPLCATREDFDRLLPIRLAGAPPAALDLLRELEPYEGGNDEHGQILPLLDGLDIELNRNGGRPIAVIIHFSGSDHRISHAVDDLKFFAAQMRLRELSEWPGCWFVTVDGMELYRVSETTPTRYKEPVFTMELSLARGKMGSTTNLPEFLGWLDRSVEEICERMLSYASPAV